MVNRISYYELYSDICNNKDFDSNRTWTRIAEEDFSHKELQVNSSLTECSFFFNSNCSVTGMFINNIQ